MEPALSQTANGSRTFRITGSHAFRQRRTLVRQPTDRKMPLAIDPNLGSVFVCGACNHIHLALGPIQLKTDIAGFQALVVLLERAAANFELWAETAA